MLLKFLDPTRGLLNLGANSPEVCIFSPCPESASAHYHLPQFSVAPGIWCRGSLPDRLGRATPSPPASSNINTPKAARSVAAAHADVAQVREGAAPPGERGSSKGSERGVVITLMLSSRLVFPGPSWRAFKATSNAPSVRPRQYLC